MIDEVRSDFQGGPIAPEENRHWTWELNALLLATHLVALDHVEWRLIDDRRKPSGLAPVGAVGRLGLDADREGFDIRQPQHIALAGHLGLGTFDFKSPLGRRHSIDHRIIEVG